MYNQVVPMVLLAAAALLAVTPTIVGQVAKDVPTGIQGLKRLLAISLWAGVVTLTLVVASVVYSGIEIWPALAVVAFLIQAMLFAAATTRFWLSKFSLR